MSYTSSQQNLTDAAVARALLMTPGTAQHPSAERDALSGLVGANVWHTDFPSDVFDWNKPAIVVVGAGGRQNFRDSLEVECNLMVRCFGGSKRLSDAEHVWNLAWAALLSSRRVPVLDPDSQSWRALWLWCQENSRPAVLRRNQDDWPEVDGLVRAAYHAIEQEEI